MNTCCEQASELALSLVQLWAVSGMKHNFLFQECVTSLWPVCDQCFSLRFWERDHASLGPDAHVQVDLSLCDTLSLIKPERVTLWRHSWEGYHTNLCNNSVASTTQKVKAWMWAQPLAGPWLFLMSQWLAWTSNFFSPHTPYFFIYSLCLILLFLFHISFSPLLSDFYFWAPRELGSRVTAWEVIFMVLLAWNTHHSSVSTFMVKMIRFSHLSLDSKLHLVKNHAQHPRTQHCICP